MTSPECGLITTPNPDIDSEAPHYSVDWHLRQPRDKSDFAHVTWPYGFLNGDPTAAADWAATVAEAWLHLLLDDPLPIKPPAEGGVNGELE